MKRSLATLLILLTFTLFGEEEDPDPTESSGSATALEKNDQPLDMLAPPSQFIVPDGEKLWSEALQRVTHPTSDTGGFFDIGAKLGEFVSAKNFHYECTAPGEEGDQLLYVLAADEAHKENNKIFLTQMRIILFAQSSVFMAKKGDKSDGKDKNIKNNKTDKAQKSGKSAKSNKQKIPSKNSTSKDNESAIPDSLKSGRTIITAPQAVIDLATKEGHASGNVTIEVFPQFDSHKKENNKPFAVLSSEHLNWRTWGDPAIGSTELALYTSASPESVPQKQKNSEEADPMVTGSYHMTQADGTETTMNIQGRGMVYEVGSKDLKSVVEDENGRAIGVSDVARNRVIFRKNIQVLVKGSTLFTPPMPFSGPTSNDAAKVTTVEKSKGKNKGKKKEELPVAPSRTLITCGGPGMIDLACIPKTNTSLSQSIQPETETTLTNSSLDIILLARKFDFFNGVTLDSGPLENAPIPEGAEPITPKRMSCKHLRIVYPPGATPSTESFPEYAEAIGGVKMSGMMVPPTSPNSDDALATQVPSPYDVSCQRMFFDHTHDNMFMVGAPGSPVNIKSSMADVRAQQFNYRSLTQTLTMPSTGPKRMVLHNVTAANSTPNENAAKTGTPKPPEAPKPDGFNLSSGGDTIIEWNGPMIREIKHLPVPGQADRLKEVLTLKDSVKIEQTQSGLKMKGKVIRVVRSSPESLVEFIRGEGGVDTTMGGLQATGDIVSVDMNYDEKGELTKNLITVIGSRKNEIKATLFMGGTAIRADKFLIDRIKDTFIALGGALAVVKAPAPDPAVTAQPAKSDAAQAAGALFKGISFQPGGNLMLQCDGDFSQDGATHTVTVKKNVLIRQPGLQLLADNVVIELNAAEVAPNASAGADTPANALFSGDLKSITCNGTVEVTTPDQLVQCDQLVHNVKEDNSLLKMNDPDNDVRIYNHEEGGGTRFISVKSCLTLDGGTGKFMPGGKLLMLPYRQEKPAPRDKMSSPERKKVPASKPIVESVETQPKSQSKSEVKQ